MHPNLSEHLHSEECNALIKSYVECLAGHPVKKYFGSCSSKDAAMFRCLQGEINQKRKNAGDNFRNRIPHKREEDDYV